MKLSSKLPAVIFSVIFMSMTHPQTPSFSVRLSQPGQGQIVQVEIENPGKTWLSVVLNNRACNEEDHFMVWKYIHRAYRQYDFSAAEEGLYTLEISDGRSRVVRKIRLQRTTGVIIDMEAGR